MTRWGRGNDEVGARECRDGDGNDEVGGGNAEFDGRPAHGWGRVSDLRFLVGQEEDAGDAAGCFGEVLDFVGLEGPAEDGALAVGEPLL